MDILINEEMWITVSVEKAESGYKSQCRIIGLDEALAACILIDVGRDILVRLAAHHPHEPAASGREEKPNGN
jgi:hypothetical protein